MAKRRCISIDFYDSEMFCQLPSSAKHLYTELILHSDDDGVIINPTTVLRICKTKRDVLELLVRRNLILKIDGIYIIRHWYVHNKVQPSRKVDSIYADTLFKLRINERKEYEVYGDILLTDCQPNITEPNLNKDNITEINSIEPKSSEMNLKKAKSGEVSEGCGPQDTEGHFISLDKNKSENSSFADKTGIYEKRYRDILNKFDIND